MTEEQRPNPDALLAAIRSEETHRLRGKLRLFFGMAAGVGKTYAMLRAAQERLKSGVDVVIGLVETHGRSETAALLQGLPVIPRKPIDYRGTVLEEMDLEAILARKPTLVLVDELAHTNVPGSRHPKRYQDVVDLLDAGIDVYSTMNVQHLESRIDMVQLITAVPVRETVPDSVLDLADQIELVDISPHELIKRFREGKIYPTERAGRALDHFFQESHLTALREIALRATADKVDQDLQGIMVQGQIEGWNTDERLMVAVSHSPLSERLIRTARRMAVQLETPWVALYVETGAKLSAEEQNRLVKNLDLARELGAEVITTRDTDLVAAIQRVARSKNIVQIVVGRPERRFWKDLFSRGNFLDRLVREDRDIDIHVIRQPEAVKGKFNRGFGLSPESQPKTYAKSAGFILAVAFLNWFLVPLLGYQAIGFIFLLAVLAVGLVTAIGPTMLAAALSATIWNFFFIPPIFTFEIHAVGDVMMFLTYFVVASVTGFFAHRLRLQQRALRQREAHAQTLYEVLKAMTLARGVDAVVQVALSRIEGLLQGHCAVFSAEGDHLREKARFGQVEIDEKERAVAQWSFVNGRVAGWSTETLPMSKVLALCLKWGDRKYGALVFRPETRRRLTPEQNDLLFVLANQIAVALGKNELDDEAQRANLLQESEKLHQTLLNSISHELRTPLTAILGAATALQKEKTSADPDLRGELIAEMVDSAERLNRVFENLLDMTRFESGLLKPNKEWFDLSELVSYTLSRLQRPLREHSVRWTPPEQEFYVEADYHLLEHALSNLLLNAAYYSPKGTWIILNVAKVGNAAVLSVADEGPGIPEALRDKIFEKFFRVPGSPAGGTGLGLSISKSIVEANGGAIEAGEGAGGGAEFRIRLPLREVPEELRRVLQ